MNKLCREGKYFCFLERQSLARSKAVLLFNDVLIPVIYDKRSKQIVTVLSQSMLSPKEAAIVQEEIDRRKAKEGI